MRSSRSNGLISRCGTDTLVCAGASAREPHRQECLCHTARSSWLLVVVLLFVATVAGAAPRYERTVVPAGRGPNRLDVDADLVVHSVAGLADVRLIDRNGRELAYLLIPPSPRQARWVEGRILPIAATKKSSGVEIDLGTVADIDRLRLEGIASPFLKRVRLEGSGDRTRWTLLNETTVFDLPDEKLRRTEIELTAGAYRYLRVVWDDRTSAPVRAVPHAAARMYASGAPPEPLRRALSFQRRGSEPGKSRYQIELPASRLPIEAIEVTVPHGHVFRRAGVSEPLVSSGHVESASLGAGTLRRAERDDAVATDMDIAIARPAGPRLELLIDDGDNAPLAIGEIVARFTPQPWIYFESPDGEPLTALAGDLRLGAPLYDLEASRKFATEANLPHARWSDDSPAKRVETPAEAPFPSTAGAIVDRTLFHVSRPVPAGQKGLALLLLDLDVLARSRQLADVRLVDSQGRQVEYIAEERGDPIVLRLPLPRRTQKRGTSIYRFSLPYESLPPGTRLELRTEKRVFHRVVQLIAPADSQRDQNARTLGSGTWAGQWPDRAPPPIRFDVAQGRRIVELRIDEGDNAPIPLESARLIVPSRALRFLHPGTPLTLLYGNATVSAPRYDLALLAPRLRGEDAVELSLAPVDPPQPASTRGERRLFWIGVAIAAAVLIILLGRLLGAQRQDQALS